MVNVEKHRKLKQNPFIIINPEKNEKDLKKYTNHLKANMNYEKHFRRSIKKYNV